MAGAAWQRGNKRIKRLATSEHFVLTALHELDRADYVDSLRDPEVREWQGFDDATATLYDRQFDDDLQRRFRRQPTLLAVRDAMDDQLVSVYTYTPVAHDPLLDTVALGWWSLAAHRGKGQSREALQMVLRWLHDEVGIGVVVIGTRADNERVLAQLRGTKARLYAEFPTELPDGSLPMGKWFTHEA